MAYSSLYFRFDGIIHKILWERDFNNGKMVNYRSSDKIIELSIKDEEKRWQKTNKKRFRDYITIYPNDGSGFKTDWKWTKEMWWPSYWLRFWDDLKSALQTDEVIASDKKSTPDNCCFITMDRIPVSTHRTVYKSRRIAAINKYCTFRWSEVKQW